MQIEDVWREAIQNIARDNDAGVSQRVAQERDRVVAGHVEGVKFSADLARGIWQRHARQDIDKLFDYVLYLLWGKLRQGWNKEKQPEDPFLGLSDLRAHLAARPPAVYDPAALAEFLGRHDASHGMGDLRSWLCGKRGRCTRRQFDLDLRSSDIEEIRRTDSTLESRADTYFAKKKLFDFPRGMPMRMHEWAHILTWQLTVGDCGCPTTAETPATDFRGYRAADKRCRAIHFISDENLQRAEGLYHDPVKFGERAVTGACTLFDQPRGFAHSMFCALYTTPGEGTIRLRQHEGKDVLAETCCEWPSADSTVDEEMMPEAVCYPCFGCVQHASCVGARVPRRKECLQRQHVWSYGTVESRDDLEGDFVRVEVNVCQARHFWPSDEKDGQVVCPCPACDLQAVATNTVEVFHPTNRDFDEIDWVATLPKNLSGGASCPPNSNT